MKRITINSKILFKKTMQLLFVLFDKALKHCDKNNVSLEKTNTMFNEESY